MSLLGRATVSKLRLFRTRGGHSKGSFFGEGHQEAGGYIFGESPVPAGQSRKWESWEAPW